MKKAVITVLAIALFSCNLQKNIKADFEVNKNETFEISLKSNPTTPYSWRLIKNDALKLVDSISITYVPDCKEKPKKPGSGGTQIWKFKAKENGIDTLIFKYSRFREPKSTIETRRIIVKIN